MNRGNRRIVFNIILILLLVLCTACSGKTGAPQGTVGQENTSTGETTSAAETTTATETTTGETTTIAETTTTIETTTGETTTTIETTTTGETTTAAERTTANETTTAVETTGASETTTETQGQNASSDKMDDAIAESTGEAVLEGSPYALHGRLSVDGAALVDEHGEAYQLKGVSTHGIGWFPQYVNKDTFAELAGWGANAIRIAMYTAEGGYCEGGDNNKQKLEELVDTGVAAATELGLYVIIDWHVLNDRDPWVHADEAEKFFDKMSEKYKDYGNVIYEICNEPNGGVDWSSVKSYAEKIIPVIRANAPDAIVIVGTPTWSQDVDKAATDPVSDYDNIMYALHFYADTHRDYLRDRMKKAIDAGLPVIVSEFGICDASGSGQNNYDEGNKWIAAMDECGVSYFIWNLSNKAETSALIGSGNNKLSGFSEEDLSESGRWYKEVLGK